MNGKRARVRSIAAAAATAASVAMTGAFAFSAAGCGDRAELWDQAPAFPLAAFGLGHAVAIVDAPAHRVVALTAGEGQALTATRVSTGRSVVAAVPAADGSALYVLGAGYRPGLGDTRPFEAPTLTVVADARADGSPAGVPPAATTIDLGAKLSDPLSGLAVDPEGRWAVLYAGGGAGAGNAFVTNPNEIVVVELATQKIDVVSLHSFGGRPERLIFTGPRALPGGAGHLLLVQSQQDLAILRLEDPATPEITVRLADAASVRVPAPAQVVVTGGEAPLTAGGAPVRVGLRFTGDTSVMTLQLDPAAGALGFAPSVNVADAGGVPSDIAFVRTDGGLRLAALVPAASRAVLVDPVTSTTTDVALPAPYQRLSLVTDPAATADVALLWSGPRGDDGQATAAGASTATGVAFWELGQAAGRPFRSIETVGVEPSVVGVLDVPLPGAALKVLETPQQGAFYVLDLVSRTAAPLLTTSTAISLSMSSTGERVWTFTPQGLELAVTDLRSKHARTLRADTRIDAVFEIGRAGSGTAGGDAGARSLVAVHAQGSVGATVYDVATADDRTRRIYGGLLTGGPYDDL